MSDKEEITEELDDVLVTEDGDKSLAKMFYKKLVRINKRIRELTNREAVKAQEHKEIANKIVETKKSIEKKITEIPVPPKKVSVENFPDKVKMDRPEWYKATNEEKITVPLAKVISDAVEYAVGSVTKVQVMNQAPGDAVAVRLTSKDARDFYNAVTTAISNTGTKFPYATSTGRKLEALVDPDGHLQVDRMNALIPTGFDYIAAAYPVATTEVYTYKSGGASGSTVGTVTVVYTDATKTVLSSVTKA